MRRWVRRVRIPSRHGGTSREGRHPFDVARSNTASGDWSLVLLGKLGTRVKHTPGMDSPQGCWAFIYLPALVSLCLKATPRGHHNLAFWVNSARSKRSPQAAKCRSEGAQWRACNVVTAEGCVGRATAYTQHGRPGEGFPVGLLPVHDAILPQLKQSKEQDQDTHNCNASAVIFYNRTEWLIDTKFHGFCVSERSIDICILNYFVKWHLNDVELAMKS